MPTQELIWTGAAWEVIQGGKTTPLPDPTSSRDELGAYGTYTPTYADVGLLPGVPLSDYNNPTTAVFTLPPGGGVVENKIIYGIVIPNVDGGFWRFKNCQLVGPPIGYVVTYATALVQAWTPRAGSAATTFSNTGRLHFTDCEFRPRSPKLNLDGISGFGYTLERCLLTGGLVDCAGSFITTNKGTHVNNRILGCILERTAYGFPDYVNGSSGATVHSDGTHNDLIQHQGGDNLEIIGNVLDGSSYGYIPGSAPYPDYPWMVGRWNAGACILLQNNTGAANCTVAGTKIKGNVTKGGGKWHVLIHANQSADFDNNRFSADVARRGVNTSLGGNYNGVHVLISSPGTSNVPGLTGATTGTNVALDGPGAGQPLTEVTGGAGLPSGRVWRTPLWPQGMTDASGN